MADTLVESGADLAAMATPEMFSGLETGATGGGDSEAAEVDTIESPASLEGESEPAETDTEETSTETPETEEPEQPELGAEAEPAAAEDENTVAAKGKQQQDEELPEGVARGKDRNGKPGLFVEDNRWKNIYGNHQLVQKFAETLGEPVTPEALQLRQEAYMAQERLFNDLNSGDPQAQGAVVEYLLDEMSRAHQSGEVGVDPAVPMAQTFYSTLRDKSPDAYATLRLAAARDLIGEMFEEASAKGDESLWLSAQHFARALANVGKEVTDISQVRSIAQRMGIPFYAKAEMQGMSRGAADPVSRLQAENARLRSMIDGNSSTNQAAQFDSWFQGVSQSVKAGVLDEAVKPALSSVEAQWQKFPNDYQDLVVDRLHRKVTETIRNDAGFNQRIKLLNDQARRATSAQKREELGQAIRQAYVNRAKLAVDALKRPILEFAANRLAERTNQSHARRQAAQNRTSPSGTNGTVPRSLTPTNLIQMKDGVFDSATAVKQARQLLGM